MNIETNDFKVEFDDSPEAKQKCYDLMLAYFKKHEAFEGEVLCQMDEPQIDAINVICDVADKAFKFKAECK